MRQKQSLAGITAALISLGMISSADAALVSRLGGQAYYDTVADLTWLADANYALTSGYAAANANGLGFNTNTINANGSMGWQASNDWVAQLTVGGVSDWRLPDTIDVGNDGATYTNIYQGVDTGYNITAHSELSNMFFNVLGNTSYYDISGTKTACAVVVNCLTNTGPFSNLQPVPYWSATEYAPDITNAWYFAMNAGTQNRSSKNNGFYAWAVRSGDVGVVPVPAAAWLFASGLVCLTGVARRRKA